MRKLWLPKLYSDVKVTESTSKDLINKSKTFGNH